MLLLLLMFYLKEKCSRVERGTIFGCCEDGWGWQLRGRSRFEEEIGLRLFGSFGLNNLSYRLLLEKTMVWVKE